jgi:hypothetical protein
VKTRAGEDSGDKVKKGLFFLIGFILAFLLQATESPASLTLTTADRTLLTYASAQASGGAFVLDPRNSSTNLTDNFNQTIKSTAYSEGSNPYYFASATAEASQNTNLVIGTDNLAISGNMTTSVTSGIYPPVLSSASASAISYVDLVFNIASPATYQFTFTGTSNVFVAMQNRDTLEYIIPGLSSSLSGTIGSGNYEFYMKNSASSNADFSFTVTSSSPVPIPAAIWLLGSGLLGLAGLRRKI